MALWSRYCLNSVKFTSFSFMSSSLILMRNFVPTKFLFFSFSQNLGVMFVVKTPFFVSPVSVALWSDLSTLFNGLGEYFLPFTQQQENLSMSDQPTNVEKIIEVICFVLSYFTLHCKWNKTCSFRAFFEKRHLRRDDHQPQTR